MGYPNPADFYNLIKDVLFEKSPLQACAECGGQSPGDLSPFVPWQMSAERREALSGPLPMIVPALGGLAQERQEREAANTS